MNIINIKDLYFTYSGKAEENSYVLKNINISIGEKQFISIHGPNGSGKTTLLKLISGIMQPQKGGIELFGNPLSSYKPKDLAKRIAFVAQKVDPVFAYSVYEVVAMGRTPYLNIIGIESKTDREMIHDTLEMMGLNHLADKCINSVSGGEAQRAFIARALVQEPEIILLDEPSSHLDLKHQVEIYDILSKLNEEDDKTIITVSHDLNLSGIYTHRAIFMKEGKIYLDGDINELYSRENIIELFGVDCDVISDNSINATPHIFLRPKKPAET
jgi:iron complex transport system ATP-binding protein